MTATFASVAVLSVGLLAGFVWWERTRPPSRLLALVATLAALAAIGRIAFAPIPNVKPTTDIVLFAGFALGAAPGFMVGAVAALSSNFFFGQGPWTPWQMAGWGLVGLLGAGLGRLLPRANRVQLALACAFAGLFYGELLNASLWVNYSDHSVGALLAYMGRGVPFDVAHMVGNVAFCLAFGPALVTALTRFELRMHVRWVPVAASVLLALTIVPAALAAPGTAKPAAYLTSAQNADGGFGGAPGQGSSELYTGWAALGLQATGRHPAQLKRDGGVTLLAYLRSHVDELRDTGAVARTMLVLGAAGVDPSDFGGRSLEGQLLSARDGSGAFDDRVNTTAFAVLALKATGGEIGGDDVRWLKSQQNPDGGFNFAGKGGASGVDDTSAPLQAIVAAGQGSSRAVRRAASFLARQQNRDGGFPLSPGGASNAQSTAWAVQGLVAAGRNPLAVRRRGSRDPLGYLRSLTAPSGAVRYSRTSTQTPVWVTGQALAALAPTPFPLPPVPRQAPDARNAPVPTATATPTASPAPTTTSRRPKPAPTAASTAVGAPVDIGRYARLVGALTAVLV
ncbi:MAG: prenyltransferase/squalene oxidase repeat-containing protein [Solirubrobacteraceae bacterium]